MMEIDLEQIKAAAMAATPGPWGWTKDGTMLIAYVDGKNEEIMWPGNAITCTAGEIGERYYLRDDGSVKASARLGACGARAETDAEANQAFMALANPKAVLSLIERLERAEQALSNPLLTGIQIHENSMDIGLKGAAAQIFAETFATQFKDSGAVNYLEVHLVSNDPAIGELLVTLQRKQGKTPHQLRREAEERLKLAEADVRRLDSGVIMTSERNEFGEEYKCERRGLNLRAMIDEAMEAAKRDAQREAG